MATEGYIERRFSAESLALIATMNGIIDDYTAQGFRLTVRQLYYQLVARDVIPNNERSYKRTTSLVNDARLAGEMDWEAIEDRTREFIRRPRWSSGRDILGAVAQQFHMDMWEGQPSRVFVLVEKEALAGVLEPTCNKYDVPLLAARGYPSVTVLREFVERDILPAVFDKDQDVLILHLGDHDPSGIDMTRDLDDRLGLLSRDGIERVEIRRIALNMPQIEEQKPPPNPAKTTDARFESYRRKFGDESWELDALEPAYLARLIERQIKSRIDDDAWAIAEQKIAATKGRLDRMAKRWRDTP